jgi:hypothetical protein
MLKMTLNHYEREYGLGNIRWIQNENLRVLLKNDELEREIKVLRKQLMHTREKLNDLKNFTFESLINLNVCVRSYKCHEKKNEEQQTEINLKNVEQQTNVSILKNVEQQTDTRILEQEDTILIETIKKYLKAKSQKKNTIYKKADKSNEHGCENEGSLNEKLKINVNENEYIALISKCTKSPIFDKNSNEIKVFLNLLNVKKDNFFGHAASACNLKISANDKLELHNFNGQKKQIITFDMKMPIKIRISNEGVLNGLLINELFELQLISFENECVRMFFLIPNQFAHALVLIYRSRENRKNYTLKKTDKPKLIDLLKANGPGKLENGTDFRRVTVIPADVNVIYMDMDDFTHAIKIKLKHHQSN